MIKRAMYSNIIIDRLALKMFNILLYFISTFIPTIQLTNKNVYPALCGIQRKADLILILSLKFNKSNERN